MLEAIVEPNYPWHIAIVGECIVVLSAVTESLSLL